MQSPVSIIKPGLGDLNVSNVFTKSTRPVTAKTSFSGGFDRMIGQDKPMNIFIGNYSLRGNDVNPKRFEMINFSPQISSKTIKATSLRWQTSVDPKNKDMALK